MLLIYDDTTAANILGGDLDPDLRALIEGHLFTAKENGLSGLTHIAIIEAGDTEQTMIDELGFSPFHNPISDKRFEQDGFEPAWDWLEQHSAWSELIFCVGDDGFAFILFFREDATALTELCRRVGRAPKT